MFWGVEIRFPSAKITDFYTFCLIAFALAAIAKVIEGVTSPLVLPASCSLNSANSDLLRTGFKQRVLLLQDKKSNTFHRVGQSVYLVTKNSKCFDNHQIKLVTPRRRGVFQVAKRLANGGINCSVLDGW